MLDVLPRLVDAYERWHDQYSTVRFRYAAVRKNETAVLLRGTIDFQKEMGKAQAFDYGELQLGEIFITPSAGLKAVENIVGGQPPEGVAVVVDGTAQAKRRDSFRGDLPDPSFERGWSNEWPGAAAILVANNVTVNEPHSPLVRASLPLIASPSSALRDWIGVDAEHRGDMQHGVAVMLPDFRARIPRIVIGENEVSVQVETTLAKERLLLKTALGYGNRTEEVDPTATDNRFTIPMPKGIADVISIFLVDRDEDVVLDWQEVHVAWAELPKNVGFELPGQQLAYLLEQGEKEDVEFKKEVGDGKELAETVVSFANGGGGVVFVGVDDNASVTGVQSPGREHVRIRDLMEALCDPTPHFETSSVTIQEREVVMVRVSEGSNKPYVHRGRGIVFVRRGGTDRAAKRADLDALYGGRASARSVFR